MQTQEILMKQSELGTHRKKFYFRFTIPDRFENGTYSSGSFYNYDSYRNLEFPPSVGAEISLSELGHTWRFKVSSHQHHYSNWGQAELKGVDETIIVHIEPSRAVGDRPQINWKDLVDTLQKSPYWQKSVWELLYD